MTDLKFSFTELMQRKPALVSLVIILILVLGAVCAPLLAPHDPEYVELGRALLRPQTDYPLGTDHLGRCVFSRLLYGSRVSLGASSLVMICNISISLVIGILAGYKGGWIDEIFMRLGDIFLAFPNLVLTLVIVGMMGPGLQNILIAMVIAQWAWYARIIRGMVLSLRESNFVLAARVSGVPSFHILLHHILPNISSQVLILATLNVGWAILHISGFSFLGLGIQPPTPEWGVMLKDSRSYFWSDPLLMLFPGLMISSAVVSFNLLGDALKEIAGMKGNL